MKRFLALCLALSLVLTLAPALGEEEKVLNIFSWEGYVDETTIANFTAETGISINYAVFASNEEMLMKLHHCQRLHPFPGAQGKPAASAG